MLSAMLNNHPSSTNSEAEFKKNGNMIEDLDFSGMKHPLRDSWTLWYFKVDRTKNWEDNLREVFSFKTVEDFWRLQNYLESPSNLATGCDYSLFKTGIAPMWEDSRNRRGGRWLLNVDRHNRNLNLDNIWLEVLLFLVGAEDDVVADNVNGGVINIRNKGDKISLWMSTPPEQELIIKNVGRQIKSRMGINVKIGFDVHEDSMKKSSSTTKYKYII